MKNVCRKCGMVMERRTSYHFPANCGMISNMVFCSYDCMTAWLYQNMRVNKFVRDASGNGVEKKGKEKEEKEGKNESAGGWF